jgi:hypothetical protein
MIDVEAGAAPTPAAPAKPSLAEPDARMGFLERIRAMAVRSLARMYRPEERLFVFRLRREGAGVVSEGLSPRYTAITLIGLAEEDEKTVAAVLGAHDLRTVYGRLLEDVPKATNLGDVALTLWAGAALGHPDRRVAVERLRALHPETKAHPTVELAWVLSALTKDDGAADDVRETAARRLLASFNRHTSVFPHVIGGERQNAIASHVSCFADLVYPTQALSFYARLTGSNEARDAARACADYMCRMQGKDGQWWWHYDYRTGRVLERYPVYAVHQDSMAPMALFAAAEVSGQSYDEAIRRGLVWLESSPELEAGTLVDDHADLIWRKVARREPSKLSRYAQALASRINKSFRVPGLDVLFPPRVVDYEDRPYHLGWVFYAFPPARAARW